MEAGEPRGKLGLWKEGKGAQPKGRGCTYARGTDGWGGQRQGPGAGLASGGSPAVLGPPRRCVSTRETIRLHPRKREDSVTSTMLAIIRTGHQDLSVPRRQNPTHPQASLQVPNSNSSHTQPSAALESPPRPTPCARSRKPALRPGPPEAPQPELAQHPPKLSGHQAARLSPQAGAALLTAGSTETLSLRQLHCLRDGGGTE